MTDLPTQIAAVTVYPDRARITRRGRLQLEPGVHAIEIVELPHLLYPDSLRLSARGNARARLSGVQLRRTFYTETPSDQVHQLEKEIEKLEDELRRLDARAEIAKQQRINLDKLSAQVQVFATALAASEMTVEKQASIFAGLRQQVEKLEDEAQAIQVSRRELERLLEKLNHELDLLRAGRPPERYTATTEVEVSQAGELTFEVSYQVGKASWMPLYDFALREQDERPSLEIGYLAQVKQETGEAWVGVALTLSTARPALAEVLPELEPWYISERRPVMPLPRMAAAAPMVAFQSLKESAMEPEQAKFMGQEAIAADEVTSTVGETGASVTYSIPGSTTVPPDGSQHKVTIARFPLTPRLDYVSAPRLAEAVYRRAKVANESPYTMLPGEANIFSADEFLGITSLELIAPRGEVEIYLGAEDRIKVERELKRREVDKRLIGGKRRMAYGYEIRLENLLPVKASLTVHDQIPVSRHEEIKVKLESTDPKPAEQTELNLLKWELNLEPSAKQTLRFDFSVESPQGMEIIGLP